MPPSRRCSHGFLVTIACLLLAGCPASESTSPDETGLPFEDVDLRFVVPQQLLLTERWAPAVNDWADENAASVDVTEIDFGKSPEKWITALADGPTSLVLMPTPLLGELAGARIAATMSDDVAAGLLDENPTPPALREAVSMLGDEQAFVVVTSPTPVLALRSDLLQAADRSLPGTWAEYDRLVSEREQWAPGLSAVEPRDDSSLASLFFARALSAAKHPSQLSVELDVSSGEALIGAPPFVRALAEMQDLTPHLAKNVRRMAPADCLSALTDGTAAIGIVWLPDDAGQSDSDSGSTDHGPLTFAPLPGRTEVYDRDSQEWETPGDGKVNRPALCGFAGYSVAVTGTGTDLQQQAAWSLWQLLARYQAEGTIPPLNGGSVSTSPSTDRDLPPGLSPAEQQTYREALSENLQNPLLECELPMTGREQLRSSLTSALIRAMDENEDPQDSLAQAAAEWTTAIKSIGRTRVQNSYRRRLGLMAVPE